MMSRSEGEKRVGGFTLAEVLMALLLAGVVAALALPALRSVSVMSAANMEARRMYSVFRTARWKAIRTGARTRVLTWRHDDSGGLSYAVQSRRGDGWAFAGDLHRTAPGLVVEVTGPAAKVFTSRGSSSFGGVAITGGGALYRLSLNPATGKVRLRRGNKDVHEEG